MYVKQKQEFSSCGFTLVKSILLLEKHDDCFCSSFMQVLKKRPTVTIHGSGVHKGLSDVAFASNHNSRLV